MPCDHELMTTAIGNVLRFTSTVTAHDLALTVSLTAVWLGRRLNIESDHLETSGSWAGPFVMDFDFTRKVSVKSS